MRVLLRITFQGCLLILAIGLAMLISYIVRHIARPTDKKVPRHNSPDNLNSCEKNLFRRPVFLTRTDD
jgi:hypothetical protein